MSESNPYKPLSNVAAKSRGNLFSAKLFFMILGWTVVWLVILGVVTICGFALWVAYIEQLQNG